MQYKKAPFLLFTTVGDHVGTLGAGHFLLLFFYHTWFQQTSWVPFLFFLLATPRLRLGLADSPRRTVLLWLLVGLKPPKTGARADRSCDMAPAPHGIYVRGKEIWALSNGLVTRIRKGGSFEPICGAAQAGGSAVVTCWTKTTKNELGVKGEDEGQQREQRAGFSAR